MLTRVDEHERRCGRMDIEYRWRDRHIEINQLIGLVYMEDWRPAPRIQVCGGGPGSLLPLSSVSPHFLTTISLPISDAFQ